MEDNHHKTKDSSHQEDTEDSTKELGSSTSATSLVLTCASSRPSLTETTSPCPAVGGLSDPPEGGNNAKRTAVANGQPPSTVSQRYMPREVPPRFRNQQEPKVLLKRGQPPLSCMLLGGGKGGDAVPQLPLQEQADTSNPTVDSVSLHLSSDASATPTYANYTWGLGSGRQPSAQGMDKDNSDVEKWPRPEDSWNSDQTPHSAGSGMESDSRGTDSSSQLSEYAEATAGGHSSSQCENKESIKGVNQRVNQHFNSKVSLLSGDQEDPQGLKPNYNPDDPDGAASGRGLLNHTASEESSPTPLSPASAVYQTLCKNEEHITGDWVELQAGPNRGGDGGISSTELWNTGEDPVEKISDALGGSLGEGTGIPQGVWDGDSVGSNKQAATGWTSDLAVGASKENVRKISEVSTDSLQDSTMFAKIVASGDDNQKAVDDWDGSEGESTGRESNEDGMHAPNLVQSPSRCQAPHPEEALQSMINHTNLDPKVLCNTGWGKTQIKQNVAWDFEGDSGSVGWDVEVHTDHSKEGWRDTGDLSNSKMQKQEVGQLGRPQGWTGHGDMNVGIGRKGTGWGEDQEVEDNCRREGTGWNRSGGSEWTPLPEGGGWNEERDRDHKNQDEGLWGRPEESGQRSSGWGGSSVKQNQGWDEKLLPSQIPNKQAALKTQNQQPQPQSQTQQQMPGYPKALQERGRPGEIDDQSKGSGWTCGPIPQIPSVVEPSGWEEPSPQSISRKMEIDDGTSAWGDPSCYNSRAVNLWDKNSSQPQQQSSGRQAGAPSKNSGSPTWTRSTGPSDPSMDSGTAPWGKSFDGWGESSEPGKKGGWGNSHSHSTKSGSKSMQEGWGDEGSNVSRHSSWEEEDGGTGVWGSRGSQSNTYNSGGWGQGQGARRLNTKSPIKGNSGDSWASPVTRQFSNMSVADEDSSMGHDSRHDRRGMNDGEMRRGGRTGGAFRSQTSKEMPSGETGPYFDKVGGHSMFGGGGIPPLRGMHQAGVHPLNPSPGIRAQVPHQFLPPQVPGPMLKPMAPPSGGMFPPQLSPQHIAMLGGIHPHMQQFQLACQLLLQQQQQQQQFLNQRKFPPPVRQQHDPQQLARIMAILQQQQGVGGPKLSPPPMGGHVPKHPDAHLHQLGMNAHKQPDGPVHAAMGGSEVHSKAPAAFPGPVKQGGGSSFSQYDVLGGSWHRGASGKVDTPPANPTWPPEFQPGVPWKGVQSPEPEPDPYMSPAGMLGSSVLSDTEHHLLQDNTGSNSLNTCMPSPGAWPYSASEPPLTAHGTAKYSELKSSWPPEPIGHGKSWRTNRNTSHLPRPPPGLSSQKQSWSGEGAWMPRAWGGGASGPESPFKSEWSDGGASGGKSWLLLRNLTPQIDGSTLRTICLQHGPLLTFHLGLTQGSALIRYCSPHEAAKAQSALHMCVLGNTTILAEFMSEEDVIRYFTHSQAAGVAGSPEGSPGSDPTPREGERPVGAGTDGDAAVGWQGLDVTAGPAVEAPGLALLSQWSNNAGEGAGKGVWGGVALGYHGSSLWGAPQLEDGTAGLLPGNLLGGGTDSL
ncbi:LOW QUALITY PROTEIN: trinucleotide repeat-containing gene 6B protein-like [Labeo rohita]|uniref:LOW QUALITY PROTEIN: trinucleotide repeat-containing gene 6B protein-like n=1 Tax=Labeo rohita TaxID=84645 RepID=UPI0021E344EA|nr:LOW QUALITY PROTEIN: trinucleotide repeat-containing gene 6B protein-like [Labeo rohita]